MVLDKWSVIVPPEIVQARISTAIADALAALPDHVREQRIAHCRATDGHGVSVLPTKAGLLFVWAGEPLLLLDPRSLVRGMGSVEELN